MKSNVILFIFLIIFAASSTKTEVSTLEESFKDVVDTDMGKLILNFANLNLQTNAESEKPGRYTALFNALDILLESLKTHIKTENEEYAAQTKAHDDLVAGYKQEIDDATAEINKQNTLIRDVLKPRRKAATEAIGQLSITIGRLQKKIAGLKQKRADEKKAYDESIANYDEAIKAINAALPLLQNLLNKKGVFAEMNTEAFTKMQANLKQALTKVPGSHGVLAEIFASISINQNFVDQGLLTTLIKKLEDLRTRFEQGKVTATDNENNAIAAFKKALGINEGLLTNAQNDKAKNEKILTETNDAIKAAKDEITSQKADRKEARKNLRKENEAFDKLTKTHEALIKKLNQEIVTVNKCIKKLESNGITRDA